MTTADILAAASLGLNLLIAIVGLTWGIGKIKDAVRDEIEEHKLRMDAKFEDTDRKIDAANLRAGEIGAAIRNKVSEVELHLRDHYVRRDSFDRVIGMIIESIKALGDKIEHRLERMETKIDQNQQLVTNGK